MVDHIVRSDEIGLWEQEQKRKNIYTTVPSNVLNREGFGKKDKVIILLKTNPGKYITLRKIAELTDYNPEGTQVELRKDITEMIEIQLLPIVASNTGVAWAGHDEGMRLLLKCQEELLHRLQGLRRRQDSLSKIIELHNGGKRWER